MASTKPVHECLFCPQTFDSAIAKDDHVLEHFAQETCTECNQHLIRIGSTLYSQHNATACIRMAVKLEIVDKSSSDIPSASENVNQYEGPEYDENSPEADVPMLTTIKMDEIYIKDEPNDGKEQQDTFESLNDLETQLNYSNTQKIERMTVQSMESTCENILASCDICEEILSSESALQTHKTLLHSQQSNDFECQVCKMKFKTKGNLCKHIVGKHDPDKDKLRCQICHQVFMNESSLQFHQCKRKEGSISCNDCGKKLSTGRKLREHQTRFHSPAGTLFCNACTKIFDSVEDLNVHKAACKMNINKQKTILKNPVSCDICGKVLSCKSSLQTHKTLLHSQQSNEFECQACKIKFKLKSSLKRHIRREHDPYADKYKCKQCKRVFMRESSLQAHSCGGYEKPVQCNDCGKILGSEKTLHMHQIKFHSPEGTIYCDGCAKVFASVDDLNKHMFVCNLRTKEQCNICGRILSSKTALQTHNTLLHSQFYHEFECYLCKKKCKRKGDLRKHMLIKHDPDKDKLKCKLCGQVFMNELSLQAHKCRDKEEPVSCDFCGKVFRYRQDLRRHQIKLHSPEGTIFCDKCAKIFTRIEDLNKHKSVCKRKTQAPCHICGKILKSVSLKKHNILFHSLEGTIYCDICARLFSAIEERDTHRSVCILRQSKTGNIKGSFECTLCKMIFTFKGSLRKHMIVVHDPCADRLRCKQCKRVFMRESSLQAHQCKSKSNEPQTI